MATSIRVIRFTKRVCARCASTYTSATPPAPPLLLKLRQDLKTAMKEKDTTRLNVLRALLADVTNASKTSKPMRTDVELLALLRKRAADSKAAVEDFQSAKRGDLVQSEEAQVRVLEEYAGQIKTISEDEITKTVREVADGLKAEGQKVDQGTLLKKLFGGGGGVFDGKPVERVLVVKAVKEYVG